MNLTRHEELAVDRARELATFADGLGDLAPQLASKSRITAGDLVEFANMLSAERSARLAIQSERDRLQALLGRSA